MLIIKQSHKPNLYLQDKSLIRTPPELRTVANQKKLCVLFEGLRCFSCLPPVVLD